MFCLFNYKLCFLYLYITSQPKFILIRIVKRAENDEIPAQSVTVLVKPIFKSNRNHNYN